MFPKPIRALLVCTALAPLSAYPADPSDAAVPVPPVQYRSAFDAYRAHTKEPVSRWRDANKTVTQPSMAHPHASPTMADDPHAAHKRAAGPEAGRDRPVTGPARDGATGHLQHGCVTQSRTCDHPTKEHDHAHH
jgi:hypothetical protein